MYRNQYDYDVSIWSPQGRLHQVEYAMEAVKQGSATIGIKSKEFAVLVALKRASSELSSYQKKIYPIDNHISVSIAGLTADGRMLTKFMRTECMNQRYAHDQEMPLSRLMARVSSRMHRCTIFYGRRPYGVGMLVAGYDSLGPHIYHLCPSANYYDCCAMAIGARSQSAKTYLEREISNISNCSSLEELMRHALLALRECLPSDVELNEKNVSISYVGKDCCDHVLCDGDAVSPYLSLVLDDQMDQEDVELLPQHVD
ncbi:Proteasome subunit alpha type-1-like [Oopsacas minuta]|uniref:Proteasome subunit alpha type n=1 Tax=Oopsacas minuta TaxID=111878 RepID=A0AAV7JJ23_9METZ|nr:Proteasome subunit alpha type-1-like [Oopsacas minuta]